MGYSAQDVSDIPTHNTIKRAVRCLIFDTFSNNCDGDSSYACDA